MHGQVESGRVQVGAGVAIWIWAWPELCAGSDL